MNSQCNFMFIRCRFKRMWLIRAVFSVSSYSSSSCRSFFSYHQSFFQLTLIYYLHFFAIDSYSILSSSVLQTQLWIAIDRVCLFQCMHCLYHFTSAAQLIFFLAKYHLNRSTLHSYMTVGIVVSLSLYFPCCLVFQFNSSAFNVYL